MHRLRSFWISGFLLPLRRESGPGAAGGAHPRADCALTVGTKIGAGQAHFSIEGTPTGFADPTSVRSILSPRFRASRHGTCGPPEHFFNSKQVLHGLRKVWRGSKRDMFGLRKIWRKSKQDMFGRPPVWRESKHDTFGPSKVWRETKHDTFGP